MRTLTQPLNMSPGGIPPVIHVSQYDSDFTIVFTLFSTVGDFTIESGTTAMVRGTKSSGTGYSADATINISAKTVTVTGNAQMTATAGQNVFEITLLKGNKEISSKNFILLCERAALDADTITDESVLKELNAIIEGAETATQAAEEAEDAADRAEAAAQSLVIDSTLTQSGQPADAKATGDLVSASFVAENDWIYGLGDYYRLNSDGLVVIDGKTSTGGKHLYSTRNIPNIVDEFKYINNRIDKHWAKNNHILSDIAGGVSSVEILDLELVENEFWGNGGVRPYSTSSGFEKYYRVKDLIDVVPGEIICLIDLGHAQDGNPNMIICGGYDADGNNAPGAIRLSSDCVVDYELNNGRLHYFEFRIPDECYKLGLHFKCFINGSTRQYEPFDFTPRLIRKKNDEYGLMLNTAYIVSGTVNYEPELHRITFNNTYFGPLQKDEQYAYGYYISAITKPFVVDWSDSLATNLNYAKHILFNSETRQLVWYDRAGNDPDGLTEKIAKERDKWFLVCVCYKNYVDIPTGFTDTTITINGVNINHIKNQHPIVESMYLKGLAKKRFGKTPTIICAGQSNAVGVTPRSALPNYVMFPIQNAGICKVGASTFSPITYESYTSANGKWGFDLIAYHFISADGNTFNVIKHAMGATSIDPSGDTDYHWTPNYEELDSMEHSLLYTLESLTRLCVDNNEIDVKAIIWHQGEGDDGARFPTAAKNYYKNFLSVVAYMRGFVGNPNLPFVCGTVPQASGQYDVSVDAAIRRVANDDPNVYLVDLKDATLLDNYHLSAAWCEYFGKKTHDCLIDAKVFSGTKLNPSKPT